MNIILKMLEVLHFTNIVDISGKTFIVFITLFPWMLLLGIFWYLTFIFKKRLWK